ncbi:class I SAM-dependent methyltransferase [Hydrococcus rivularis]|uniref:class I SAM-dependent methyltransferase n=1 Tax=Hydrococcus rivularis TaxID=1616834 RepID=UPI001C31AE08|nr:methyltransferase domain-containing protein [Hydrococcus rivularis]
MSKNVILVESSSFGRFFFIAQTWNSETYAKNARFVSDLGMPVVELLNSKVGERILDLGCGDGALTMKLQEFGCEAIGVDSSPNFIRSAQSLGLDARLLDGHHLPFKVVRVN